LKEFSFYVVHSQDYLHGTLLDANGNLRSIPRKHASELYTISDVVRCSLEAVTRKESVTTNKVSS